MAPRFVIRMSPKCRQGDIEAQPAFAIMGSVEKNQSKELVVKQPDLGITVAKLRVQKGLTQEQLAECCEVSKRNANKIPSREPMVFCMELCPNIYPSLII